MPEVIAYAYDADIHCRECTISNIAENYGIERMDVATDFDCYEDFEGNPIHAMFDTDEWYANDIYEGNKTATLNCSDCGKELDRWEADD